MAAQVSRWLLPSTGSSLSASLPRLACCSGLRAMPEPALGVRARWQVVLSNRPTGGLGVGQGRRHGQSVVGQAPNQAMDSVAHAAAHAASAAQLQPVFETRVFAVVHCTNGDAAARFDSRSTCLDCDLIVVGYRLHLVPCGGENAFLGMYSLYDRTALCIVARAHGSTAHGPQRTEDPGSSDDSGF
eukprot:5943962-Prymnesium_polylepis.2